MAVALAGLGILLSAVQWVPSKELLDRSPRAEGLSWAELTYASWHPELLPTMVVREAYGTRARDTDWMDGFYPYHEMNTYLGLIAIVLAVVVPGKASARPLGHVLGLAGRALPWCSCSGSSRFCSTMRNKIPIAGSSREPVRFHLWAAMGVAALGGRGVERLVSSPGVSLRPGLVVAGGSSCLSIPILLYVYAPVWKQLSGWNPPRSVFNSAGWAASSRSPWCAPRFCRVWAWFVAWKGARTSDPIDARAVDRGACRF